MKEPRRHSPKASHDGEPRVHPTAELRDCILGRFTIVGVRVVLAEVRLGDYSYFSRGSEAIYATIGKFTSIASNVRINALAHPMGRLSQHNITYRPNEYFLGAKIDKDFRELRRGKHVNVGHDVWIGHGAILLPGVTIGHGAVIGAGAVVTRDVAPYSIVLGTPAVHHKWRFEPAVAAKVIELAWWDWPHDKLAEAIPDMQLLSPEDFVSKWRA
jgi:phosphonate metabolism protein (transferase hexapeptide repeat family)